MRWYQDALTLAIPNLQLHSLLFGEVNRMAQARHVQMIPIALM
jgi:hypothetical protein